MDEVPLTAPTTTPKPKAINLEECILCQQKKRSEYLSSGEIGRGKIVLLSKQMKNNDSRATRVLQLTLQEQGNMKYHSSSCYRSFQRDMAKAENITQPLVPSEPSQPSLQGPVDVSEHRSKRLKSSVTTDICIFCGAARITHNKATIHRLYRICEKPMAQKLLNAAMLFKDNVFIQISTMCDLEDVFAADVKYHDFCRKGYFNKYHAKIEEILANLDKENSVTAKVDSLRARFLALGLDFSKSAHSLTSIRDMLNKSASGSDAMVSNRVVKQLIIELYGEGVCFTYPSNKRMSQMVFCTKSSPAALVESLRVPPVQTVATKLAQELREYRFGLQSSFCDPHDLQLSMDIFAKNPPPTWKEFCFHMFKGKTNSLQKTDVIFQIIHYILNDGKEPTPFHVMLAQGIHSLTRSKELVTALNRHGLCISYKSVKKIDVDLAEKIIDTASDNRVPLPVLEATSPLNGAMDNFDRNESTLTGTGSTHDTILVLFQNVPIKMDKPSEENEISVRPLTSQTRTTVKLRSKVNCQQLIRMGAMKERGEIPSNYKVSEVLTNSTTPCSATADNSVTVSSVGPSTNITESTNIESDMRHTSTESNGSLLITDPTDDMAEEPTLSTRSSTKPASVDEVLNKSTDPSTITTYSSNTAPDITESTKSINLDYFLWIVNRLSRQATQESEYVPGFTAVRSLTATCNFHPTTTILTPILPYPATTHDAIFTTMINFQDALKQKGDSYGGLWADEGVYHIAKEIQLLKPDIFDNIFLGLGGFHMEKIVLACLGTYLEPSGIFAVLVETECYGTDVIKTVIFGSHYSRARTAHSMINEVITSMMLKAFFNKYPERQTELEALQVNCQSKDLTSEDWNTIKEHSDTLREAFEAYLKERASQSKSFNYWYTYVFELFPIVRDLTNSMRTGDWDLYISAVERATSLFFFFGRTNYCRWTPLFLQDCYQLKEKFPHLYDSYMNGGFVVNTASKGSGVPFDQALEQCYNRPAKVSGGIIGVTRKKEAVALWAIIKHEKDQYVDLLKGDDDVEGELSLHHDFNPSTANKIVDMVKDIEDYLLKVSNPLEDQIALKNILTGETVTKVNVDKLMSCVTEGGAACAKFIDDRLRKRSVSIHSTISKIKYAAPLTTQNLAPKANIKDETIKALMCIEYGCERGFTVEELLQHEITNYAFFLVTEDGFLRKSAKSQLGTELMKLCPQIDTRGPESSPQTHAIIIDFMAMVRKIPLKKLDPPVKTFYDFAVTLTSMVIKAGHNCDEIHIVFDTYREDSIKNEERERRGKSREMVVLDKISPNQNVPVVLENFWSSSTSKSAFQAFYVEWLISNYQGNKPLYLGISPQAWRVSNGHACPFPRLNCTHEEADDRMMFHVQDILSHRSEPTSIMLSSGDTDVFVCLLYHITVNWRALGLEEFWLIRNTGVKRSLLPLHTICTTLGDELTKCLPALHALSGCDTTSKIATKLSALNAVRKPENSDLIKSFDSPQLTENGIQMAETFLVKCLKPSTDISTFNDLRLAAFSSNALNLNFERTPCTSTNIRKHILRGYYQLQLWVQAPFRDASVIMNAEAYGFVRINNLLVPEIVTTKPEGLPDPCTCGKCARKTTCPCRVAEIRCCKYCKCKAGDCCKNPITE